MLASIEIVLDKNELTSQRVSYTIFDALSDTGGFMSIFFVLIEILMASTQESLFHFSMIKRLFLYQKELELDETSNNKAKIGLFKNYS